MLIDISNINKIQMRTLFQRIYNETEDYNEER